LGLLVVVQAVAGSSPVAHPPAQSRSAGGILRPDGAFVLRPCRPPGRFHPHYRPQNPTRLTAHGSARWRSGYRFVSRSGGSAVADLLTEVRRDIDRRLDELRPVVDEFRRLEQARDALRSTNSSRGRRRESSARTEAGRTRMTKAQSQEIDSGCSRSWRRIPPRRPPYSRCSWRPASAARTRARLVRDGEPTRSKRGKTIRYRVPPGGDRHGH
jgi:hypothetical protein